MAFLHYIQAPLALAITHRTGTLCHDEALDPALAETEAAPGSYDVIDRAFAGTSYTCDVNRYFTHSKPFAVDL